MICEHEDASQDEPRGGDGVEWDGGNWGMGTRSGKAGTEHWGQDPKDESGMPTVMVR